MLIICGKLINDNGISRDLYFPLEVCITLGKAMKHVVQNIIYVVIYLISSVFIAN